MTLQLRVHPVESPSLDLSIGMNTEVHNQFIFGRTQSCRMTCSQHFPSGGMIQTSESGPGVSPTALPNLITLISAKHLPQVLCQNLSFQENLTLTRSQLSLSLPSVSHTYTAVDYSPPLGSEKWCLRNHRSPSAVAD